MFKKFKWFSIGFIVSLICTLGMGSYAAQTFQLLKANFMILVNGVELKSDLPVMLYNGNTYVPLRKVSEITGSKVDWMENIQTIKITQNSTTSPSVLKNDLGLNISRNLDGDGFTIKDLDSNKSGIIYGISSKGGMWSKWNNDKLLDSKMYITELNDSLSSNKIKGKFGDILISYDKDNNKYNLIDEDINGTGSGFSFDEKGAKYFKYENKVKVLDLFMLPSQTPTSQNLNPIIPSSTIASSNYKPIAPLKLYSDETKRVYLGKLTSNTFDTESLFNEYSIYGNEFSSKSIWNEFSTYGNEFSSYSPFNEFTSTPPLIIDGSGTIVGRLTLNKYVTGAITPNEILSTIKNLGF